jgi:hypothetical protein
VWLTAEALRAQSWKIERAKHVLSEIEGTPRTQRKISSYLSELGGPFGVAQDMLCAFARDILTFSCGPAALRLCAEYCFTVNPEEPKA